MLVRNKQRWNRVVASLLVCTLLGLAMYITNSSKEIGDEIDSYKGVAVYYNGPEYIKSHGQYYSKDGYYYGQKWQCVEFVRRFYYQVNNHRMPDMYGNAADYYDPAVAHGRLNHRRGLIQYRNGGNVKPEVDDLIVFTDGEYGHVAIITEVGDKCIEVIQQNTEKTRQIIPLMVQNNHYYLGNHKQPSGWLRKEED